MPNKKKQPKEINELAYKKIMHSSPNAVIVTDMSGKILDCNQASARLHGFSSKKAILGIDGLKLVAPKSIKTATGYIEDIIKNKTNKPQEYTLLTKDKKEFIGEISASILRDQKKRPIAIVIISKDITDKKRAETILKESEEKFRRFFEREPSYCYLISSQGTIIDINKAALKALDYKKNELLGKPLKTIYAPESLPRAKQLFAQWKKTGKVTNEELNIITKHGKKRTVVLNSDTLKNEQGKIIHSISVQYDITERKQTIEALKKSEEKFRLLVNNASDTFAVVNRQGLVTFANKAFFNTTGYRRKDLKNFHFSKLIHSDDLNLVTNNFKKRIGAKNADRNYGFRIITKSGEIKHISFNASVIKENNKISSVQAILRDVTETKLLQEKIEGLNKELEKKVIQRTKQLDEANQELNQALKLKSKFISDASHELRTPLTILRGNLDLTIRDCKNSNKQIPASFTAINKEVRKMTKILSDLSLLSSADANTEKIDYEPVNINLILKAVAQSLKILAKQKNIKIKCKKSSTEISIMGDENKLEKLFLNLVRNSIRYGNKNGHVKIWVANEKDNIKVHIKDNGIGIPNKDLPYIFERFYRIDRARSMSDGGTGIGLSISKWVAEAHKGYISVESKLGKGSTFTVHLPCDYKKQTPFSLF